MPVLLLLLKILAYHNTYSLHVFLCIFERERERQIDRQTESLSVELYHVVYICGLSEGVKEDRLQSIYDSLL